MVDMTTVAVVTMPKPASQLGECGVSNHSSKVGLKKSTYLTIDLLSVSNMWRTSGEGESYLYIPKDVQVSTICSNSLVICNADYGYSVGRGTWDWATGEWNTITQVLQLNTVGQQDGVITEKYGGTTEYTLGQLVFRQSDYGVAGIGKFWSRSLSPRFQTY